MNNKKKENKAIDATLKSMDTEEWIDLLFYRPLGYRWALLFERLGIAPNTVSLLSIVLGMTGGFLFFFTDVQINIIGMFLIVWANTYDSADGQLARMTKNFSPIGRILDGFCGDLWFFAIYFAICMRLTPQWGIWIWILAAATGWFHTKQAQMADYIRNFHILFVKGGKTNSFDDYKTLKKQYESMSWKNDFVVKLFTHFYLPYTKGQEKRTPKLQAFRQTMHQKFGEEAPPLAFREAFRAASKPMMKYTNILTFNIRTIALFVSLLIGEPWLYFVFEITVLNALLIYLLLSYEKICQRFDLRLRGDA